MKFQAPKGISEYLPPRLAAFEFVRESLIASAQRSGYQLVELPVFEDTELFARGVGETTDVVTKEMYTFTDRGGRSITLRPEGTAGVMRAVIEHSLDRGQLPVKLWYAGQFFRAERPQAGRYRQFYQMGIEAIGMSDPEIDVEVIAVADRALRNMGLRQYRLDITSLGDVASRKAHRVELDAFIATLDLDEATQKRASLNPLRLFDDKRPEIRKVMAKAPILLDFLSDYSRDHFARVRSLLDALEISYVVNPRMVRGLDYYTGTTFEFVHDKLGAQSGIGGGGRYDGLMHELGGADLSGIGFGMGLDRIIMALEAEGLDAGSNSRLDLFLIPLGEKAKRYALVLADQIRQGGASVDIAFGDRSLKGGMKAADKSGATYSIVLGDQELETESFSLKRMSSGETASVTISSLLALLTQEKAVN
jgi:histidyl-tRNA synthetase